MIQHIDNFCEEDAYDIVNGTLETELIDVSVEAAPYGGVIHTYRGPHLGELSNMITEALAEGGCFDIQDGDKDGDKDRDTRNLIDKRMPLLPAYLVPCRVWFNPPYTTAEFYDGAKVTVKAEGEFNEFSGFACCIVKKMFGSTSNAIYRLETVKELTKDLSPKETRKRMRELHKEAKAARHQMKIKEREHRIAVEMDRMRIQKEAEKRLDQEEKEDEE